MSKFINENISHDEYVCICDIIKDEEEDIKNIIDTYNNATWILQFNEYFNTIEDLIDNIKKQLNKICNNYTFNIEDFIDTENFIIDTQTNKIYRTT